MDEANVNDAKTRPRGHWRPGEDEKLRQLVEQYGPQNWNSIAEKLQGLSGKSCRYRWFNHLNPGLNSRPFSEDEEDNGRLFGKRRYHNFISSSTGNITMSNFLTKPSTDEDKEIKDGFLVLPQQMAAASRAFPASEITGTSMGPNFLGLSSLSTEDCSNGVTTMNELSSHGESSAGPQKFG
ncbi:Transcription factor [Nymphaea thermarum]|nr:Transcription factor [Nymphaea thermarum]